MYTRRLQLQYSYVQNLLFYHTDIRPYLFVPVHQEIKRTKAKHD